MVEFDFAEAFAALVPFDFDVVLFERKPEMFALALLADERDFELALFVDFVTIVFLFVSFLESLSLHIQIIQI